MSFAVALFALLLLASMMGYTVIPNGVSIVAIFVLSIMLSVFGTKYNNKKRN
ncbi:hypothetical protein [Salinibacillus kushneri]|nr:hypothetical protein [Salinibacillus kushneri]